MDTYWFRTWFLSLKDNSEVSYKVSGHWSKIMKDLFDGMIKI